MQTCRASGFSLQECKSAGFSALDVKQQKLSIKDCLDLGFPMGDLGGAFFVHEFREEAMTPPTNAKEREGA